MNRFLHIKTTVVAALMAATAYPSLEFYDTGRTLEVVSPEPGAAFDGPVAIDIKTPFVKSWGWIKYSVTGGDGKHYRPCWYSSILNTDARFGENAWSIWLNCDHSAWWGTSGISEELSNLHPLLTVYPDETNSEGCVTVEITARDKEDANNTCVAYVILCADGIVVSNGINHYEEDPVAPFDGRVVSGSQRDFVVKDPALPIDFYRAYDSTRATDGPFGIGWSHSYNVRLVRSGARAFIYGADNLPSSFLHRSDTSYFDSQDQRDLHLKKVSDTTYSLLDEQYRTYTFVSNRLVSVADRNGNSLVLAYENDLLRAVSNRTACLSFLYDGYGHVASVTDSFGRATSYGYSGSNLEYVVDIAGGTTTYNYAGFLMTNYVRVDGATVTYVYGEDGRGGSNQCTSVGMDGGYFAAKFGYFTAGGKGKSYKEDPESGVRTTNTFDRRGMIEKFEYPDGSATTYGHSGIRRSSVVDENGNTNYTTYGKGRIKRTTDAKGSTTIYNYYADIPWNQPDLLQHVAVPGGIDTYYYYDTRTNVARIVHGGVGESTSFSYNPDGTLAASWNALAHVWTNTYTSAGWLASATDPLGNTTCFAYDARGNATNIMNPRGALTRVLYDVFDRPVTTISPNGATNRVFYDKAGRVAATQNALGCVFTTIYNTVGLPTSVVDPLGNRVDTTFDKQGQPARRAIFDASDSSTRTTTNIYNLRGRLAKTISPLGTTNEYYYDPVGNLVSNIHHQGSSIQHHALSYDRNYNVTLMRDALGRETAMAYDSADRLIHTTNALDKVVGIVTYDGIGRIATMKERENTDVLTSYTYDQAGRRTQTTVSGAGFNLVARAAYDAAGNVSSAIDPAGTTNAFSYDATDNLTRHVDELGRTATFTYDSMDRLSSVTDPLGTTWSNAYDRMGNVVSHLPSYSDADTFQHDALGRVTQMTSPAGSFTCSNNAANLVTWQAFDDGRTNLYIYDAGYRLTNASTVGAGSSCVRESYAYDAVGNATNVSSGGTQAPASTLVYTYDAANQRTSRRLCLPGLEVQEGYQYDALGRLTSISNGFVSATYVYDEAGNLTGKVVNSQSTILNTKYSFDALDRLVNLESSIQHPASNVLVDRFAYTYEPSRSLLTHIAAQNSLTHMYAYDAAGQLLRDNDERYTYDGAGRIAGSQSATGSWSGVVGFWSFDDPGNVLADITGHGNTLVHPNPARVTTGLPATVNTNAHPGAGYGNAYNGMPYVPYHPMLDATNFTIAGFMKWRGRIDTYALFASRGAMTGWTFGYEQVGTVSNALTLTILTNRTLRAGVKPGIKYYTNAWHHLALTRAGDTFTIYMDGVALTNTTWNDAGPLTNSSDLYLGCSSTNYVDEIGYWSRALSDNEVGLLYSDTYSRANLDSIGCQYSPGNMLGAVGTYSNAATADVRIECDSPADLTTWQVDANGVRPVSSNHTADCTTFVVTNVPLGGTCAWAKVSLDGRAAAGEDGEGYSRWGNHQPATNNQLHFKVEPAVAMGPGVFAVASATNNVRMYDPSGQMIEKSSAGGSPVSYAYDSARNMKQCVFDGGTRTNFYHYDHARRLVKETHTVTGVVEESSSYVYDGMDVVLRFDNLSGEMVYFTRGLGIAPGVGDILAETHILGSLTQTYVYVQNHRGDTIALVDGASGTIAARYEYSAWGEITSHTGSNAWFTFSGKHYDADAGLYCYGFRWYDAVAKRWTQPDPAGLSQGLDQYRFCENDPLNGVDAYGLSAANDIWQNHYQAMTTCRTTQSIGGYGVGLVEGVWNVVAGVPKIPGAIYALCTTSPGKTVQAIKNGVVQTYNQIMQACDSYESGKAIGSIIANIEVGLAMGPAAKAASLKIGQMLGRGAAESAAVVAGAVEGDATVAAKALIQANRAQGLAAEAKAVQILENQGNIILGRQVTAQTSLGRRVIDILYQTSEGQVFAMEVKSGNAMRTALQAMKDIEMATVGARIVGKNAPAFIRDTTSRITTSVMNL